jgi:tetratricopeptide (TPR) repeat protein
MTIVNSTCSSCGLRNPRQWRTCARCGNPLGSSFRIGGTFPGASVDAGDVTFVERGIPGDVEMPLLGQNEVTEALQASIERGFTLGLPSLIGLEGPPGSGKSRLLIYASEFAARIATDLDIYYAGCREGDGGYAPFTRLLLDRFEVAASTAPQAVRAQMSTAVGEAIGAHDAIRIAETTHLLGHVAGVPFPDSPFLMPLEGNPVELGKRASRAVRRLFEGDSQKRPALLLLDNMHEADDAAWAMLESLVDGEGHLAVVVSGQTGVTKRIREVRARGETAVLEVPALREEDVASMLLVLVPSLEEVPEPVVAALAHRSGGNPRALRELVFTLTEANFFVETPGGGLRVDVSKLERGDLPVTVDDAIQARLARLDANERSALEHAAVVGQVFWSGAVLAQIRSEREAPGTLESPTSLWPTDADWESLQKQLGRLVDKGLVLRSASSDIPGTDEFSFVYPPLRNFLYEQVAETARTRLHAVVARYLALRAELSREGIAARIAPHLERAGLTARAGRAYLEAAATERKRLQTNAALRYIERALPLISPDDASRQFEALHEYGVLLSTTGRYEEAERAFAEMLRLAWQNGAPNKGGAALNRLARIARMRGADEEARVLLDRALVLFRRAGDLRGVASTLDDLAQILRLQGGTDTALEAATEALTIRREYQDTRGEAVSLMTLGTIELGRGQVQSAEQFFRASKAIREEIGDLEGLVHNDAALAIVAYERGAHDEAVASWRSALTRARDTGDVRMQTFLLNNIGEAALEERRFDEASTTLSEAWELAESTGDLRARAEIARNLAMLSLRRDDDDAERRVVFALEIARSYGSKELIGLAQRALGILYGRTVFRASGEVDRRAEDALLSSIDLFVETGNEKEAARSTAELGLHLAERGDVENAIERLREARAVLRKLVLTKEAERVEVTLRDLGA